MMRVWSFKFSTPVAFPALVYQLWTQSSSSKHIHISNLVLAWPAWKDWQSWQIFASCCQSFPDLSQIILLHVLPPGQPEYFDIFQTLPVSARCADSSYFFKKQLLFMTLYKLHWSYYVWEADKVCWWWVLQLIWWDEDDSQYKQKRADAEEVAQHSQVDVWSTSDLESSCWDWVWRQHGDATLKSCSIVRSILEQSLIYGRWWVLIWYEMKMTHSVMEESWWKKLRSIVGSKYGQYQNQAAGTEFEDNIVTQLSSRVV